MSSSAPVVHIDEFLSRRNSRATTPLLPEEVLGAGGPAAPSRGAATSGSTPRGRVPRPRLVRACSGRAVVEAGHDPAPVALTRRGRLAVLVMVLVFLSAGVVASVGLAGGAQGARSDGGQVVRTRTVTVAPGETLWEIAARVDPHADIRATVEEIARLNGLASAGDLEMGQSLVVPASDRSGG
jgi:hypothetical protein